MLGAWTSELKKTLRLAGPIVAGNVGQILIGVVDTFMIGRVGVAELGASAFVNNLLLVPLVTLIGLFAAVTVLVSQARGAGDAAAVGGHIGHGLLLSLVCAGGAVLVLSINGLFLDGYGQEEAVVEAAWDYYWLMVLSLVPALVYQCLKCVCEGLGWSNPPMVILLSGICVNAGLNWLLIFGKLGFPELGLAGAGWATLIARCLIALGMLAFLLRAKRLEGLLPRRWLSGYAWKGFRSILKLGVPSAGQHMFEVGAFAGAGVIVGWLGKEALAAHQVALSCAAMAFMVPLGVSIACGIRVGAAFGSGDFFQIRLVYLSTLGFTVFQTVLAAAFFLFFGSWLAGFFVEDELVVELAAAIFVVVGLFQIFDGVQVACMGALRGMSDVNVPVLVSFLSYWALALPLGYVLGFWAGLGPVGVWIGLAVGLAFASACLLRRLVRLARQGRGE